MASEDILKREIKGVPVTLVSEGPDGWSKVADGNITVYAIQCLGDRATQAMTWPGRNLPDTFRNRHETIFSHAPGDNPGTHFR